MEPAGAQDRPTAMLEPHETARRRGCFLLFGAAPSPDFLAMKYDDASWHSGGDFPTDLPPEAGATHTGMFVAWCLLSGLAGDIHLEDLREGIPTLTARSITPGAFFLSSCDGKFTDEDLNDQGNAFTRSYFDFSSGKYLNDYCRALGISIHRIYYAADTWKNFDRLRPVLDKRYAEWKKRKA